MARDPQVRMIVRSLEGFTTRRVTRIVLNATANLTEDTPRDLGWARNNWIPEIGPGPDNPVGERTEAGAGAAQAAQQQGIAAIVVSYKLGMGIITISNNVPYIVYLNEGSSPQASPGFVQAAILRAVQDAEKPGGGGGSLISEGGS
jgi:hypothetical protein